MRAPETWAKLVTSAGRRPKEARGRGPCWARRARAAPPSIPGLFREPESAGAPGKARSERSRHGPGDGETRRRGEPGGIPLRPGAPRLAPASSDLLPRPAAAEEAPRGRCWGRRHLPHPSLPRRRGSSQQRVPPESGRPAGAAVFAFISIAALCFPVVRPDPPPPPPLPPPGPPPLLPTPICCCQMRKSPRRFQALRPPRAPFGARQRAAAGSPA